MQRRHDDICLVLADVPFFHPLHLCCTVFLSLSSLLSTVVLVLAQRTGLVTHVRGAEVQNLL